MASIDFEQLSKQFSPLDLMFFRGTDLANGMICAVSQITTGENRFSHVGLIVNSEILPTVKELQPGKWYIWESTTSATSGIMANFVDNTPNIITGKGKFGVQIRDLEALTYSYTKDGGEMAWARLKNNPWTNAKNKKERHLLISKISSIQELLGDRTYDANCLSLLGAGFPCCRKPRDRMAKFVADGEEILVSWNFYKKSTNNQGMGGWLFCSEMVATVYQDLGLIDDDKDPQDVIPVDFLGVDVDGIPKLVEDPIYISKPDQPFPQMNGA